MNCVAATNELMKSLVRRAIERGQVVPQAAPDRLAGHNKTRERYKALGLTVRGTPRQYPPYGQRKTPTEYARLRRAGLVAQGLTTRGTPRAAKPGATEKLILVAEIEAAAQAIGVVFWQLSPDAQAKCLRLANHLAALRLSAL